MARIHWTVAVGVTWLGLSGLASAQTSDVSAVFGTPQSRVEAAKRLASSEKYLESMGMLAEVLDTVDESDPAVQAAQFELGKVLLSLDLPLSASYAFGDIADAGEGHAHYFETIDWFLKVQRRIPGDEESLLRLAEYDPSLYPPGDADEIRYLVGRYHYNNEEFTRAIESLEAVGIESEEPYLRAQHILGVAYTRLNQAQPALEAFKSVLRYQRDVSSNTLSDEMAGRAMINIGRLFYTTGKHETATRYYDQIDQDEPYWLDSLFEISWAYYQLGNYERALGNLHTLNSPYFADTYHPEALILQAVILLTNCHFKPALVAVEDFVKSYKPLRDELEVQLKQTTDPTAFYQYLARLSQQDKKAQLSPALKRVFNAALQDVRLRRLLAYVLHLNAENKTLEALLKASATNSAQQYLATAITVLSSYRDMVIGDAGQAAHNRLKRVHRELGALLSQALRIKFETLRGERTTIAMAKRMTAGEVAAQKSRQVPSPSTDEEHRYWPFEGEYWRDELGAYTYLIANRCLKKKQPQAPASDAP